MSLPCLLPIRVAPGGRYFETTDGHPFLFIGPNDAVTWPGLMGLYRRRDLDSVEAYLGDLAASGVTVLRLMLEYVHREGRYFERRRRGGVGLAPNPEMVRLWDDLFARCEAHGLRVLLTPWDNFWMAYRWHRHPYNRINGGPADTPGDFFTREEVIKAVINRLRFVVERWGGSGVIAAWDLFNEIHPYWGGTPQEQFEVITRISNALRDAEQKAWGFTRLQTVSVFGPQPDEEYEKLIFRHPCLDFATTHVYHAGAIDYPTDTVQPALSMAHWVRYALERVPPGRPYLDSEHGPIHLFNDHHRYLPEAFDDEYEQHIMWAHLASGGAGSGMRWPARHPHMTTPGMRRAYRSLARFTQLIDWRTFTPHDARSDVHLSVPGVHVFAVHDAKQAIAYLLRDDSENPSAGQIPTSRGSLSGIRLTLRGMAPGRCRVHVWEPATGSTVTEGEYAISLGKPDSDLGTGDTLSINVPPFQTDLALAVTRFP